MNNFSQKRILILFTGGTIAGNVAQNNVVEKISSDPNTFVSVLENSVQIIKKNWNIDISADIIELFNLDSSCVQPENWMMIVSKIQEQYDSYDAFIVLH
jgi:L-asparaginase